jgi:hypothetical protein
MKREPGVQTRRSARWSNFGRTIPSPLAAIQAWAGISVASGDVLAMPPSNRSENARLLCLKAISLQAYMVRKT